MTITLNDEEIVVKANKLGVSREYHSHIRVQEFKFKYCTLWFKLNTSSLGTATSTILSRNNLNSSTSSIGDSIATSFEIQKKSTPYQCPLVQFFFIGESAPDGTL